MREERALRRQLRHDAVISFLALVSVGIGVYELLRPRVDRAFTLLDALDLTIVLVFIVDFTVRARASGDWRRYVKRHWWELPSLVPITGGMVEGIDGVALLRGARLVRVVRVVRLVRVLGAAARIRRVRRYLARVADRARLVEIALVGVALVLGGATVAFLVVPEGAFSGFADALWWSLNLFTTVAYVEQVPLGTAGRVLGAFLMVTGVAFVGVFTASLANALLKEPEASPEDEEPEPAVD